MKDSLFSQVQVQLITSLQKEDIFSFLSIGASLTKKLSADFGLGYAWRRGAQSLKNGFASQGSFRYDMVNHQKVFLGPAIRFSFSSSAFGEQLSFRYKNVGLGYYFSLGNTWRVVQSGYFGVHHMQYRDNSGSSQGVMYGGYAIQLGVGYVL